VNASDYSIGGHTLELVVVDADNIPWSKTLRFTVSQAVTGITLNKSALTLPVNGSETLYVTVSPANAGNKNVTWSSNNTTVASVTSSGLVQALTLGTATITATSEDESHHIASCTVTVTASQDITLRFGDPGSGAFSQDTFTVVKGGSPANQTITVTGSWTGQEWRVDGRLRGTGTSFTVDASDYTVGGHTLELIVVDGTVPWSKTLRFTVSN
jgi:uncharacterized protein YjdB